MDVARLREQAEALIASDNHAFPGADILDLLDEFEAYQVTLDTQRAELQLARAKIESLQRRFEDLYMFTPVS